MHTSPVKEVTSSKPSSVRVSACTILLQVAQRQGHADDLVHKEQDRHAFPELDRGLLMELVLGTLRQQGALDAHITPHVTQPFVSLEPIVQILLRLGAHQILNLDRIPTHAAVHETVNAAQLLAPRATGLINAVLRSLVRQTTPTPLPDRHQSPKEWLAATLSLPIWLAEEWIAQIGLDEAAALAAMINHPPKLTVRKTTHVSHEQFLKVLADHNIPASPCYYAPDGYTIHHRGAVQSLPGYREGWFTVQDEAAQLVSLVVAPQANERLLDMCAAPGGKTVHLAELGNGTLTIVATDNKKRRMKGLEETIQRLRLSGVTCHVVDALSPDYLKNQFFDRILLDAPCSGLGVLQRNPEAKWFLTPSDVQRCQERQRGLLAVAAHHLRPGGVLVYATCSTSRQENEDVLHDFLSQNNDFMIDTNLAVDPRLQSLVTTEGFIRLWPHRHGTDGFFAAKLLKRHTEEGVAPREVTA